MRRNDRYRPRDLYLADHRVSLQGRIDPSLLDHFFRDGGRGLALNKSTLEYGAGDRMTVCLPVTGQPKRLLLDFSVGLGDAGGLPMLNRYEDSWVEALHLLSLTGHDVLLDADDEEAVQEAREAAEREGATADEIERCVNDAKEAARSERDKKTFPLLLVLATLVFVMPEAIEKRVTAWDEVRRRASGEDHPPPPVTRPLAGLALEEWIESQADLFLPGLGAPLRQKLAPYLDELLHTRLTFEGLSGRDVLTTFGSIPLLLLHGIRDFLKLLYDATPEWLDESAAHPRATGVVSREELIEDPERLAGDVFDLVVDGLALLEVLHGPNPGSPGAVALSYNLDSWWAYAQVEVELGTSFLIKTSEVLPLSTRDFTWSERLSAHKRPVSWFVPFVLKLEQWARTFYDAAHYYPVHLKDAQSVHVEVEVPHPELRMPRIDEADGLRLKALIPDDLATTDQYEETPLEPEFGFAFGTIAEPSDRLFHAYSSRQLHEAPDRDILNPWLQIYVPLRFRPSIFFGYTALTISYAVAATFIAVVVIGAMIDGRPPSQLAALVTVGALAVSLSLWMTGASNPEAIVAQKLVVARRGLELCVFTIVATFVAYGLFSWGGYAALLAMGLFAVTVLGAWRLRRRVAPAKLLLIPVIGAAAASILYLALAIPLWPTGEPARTDAPRPSSVLLVVADLLLALLRWLAVHIR
jgi:hypothetical protein